MPESYWLKDFSPKLNKLNAMQLVFCAVQTSIKSATKLLCWGKFDYSALGIRHSSGMCESSSTAIFSSKGEFFVTVLQNGEPFNERYSQRNSMESLSL